MCDAGHTSPACKRMRAVAAPMPDAAPEMMATLPASLMVILPCYEWCSTASEVRPVLVGEGLYRFPVALGKIGLPRESRTGLATNESRCN
jgi:hypothetical protein